VNYLDLMMFGASWLNQSCVAPDWCGGADLDHSGVVDFGDFAVLASNWLS
jgi:hypothetical protein